MRLLCCCLLLCSLGLPAETLRIVSSEFVPHNGAALPNQGYAIELVRQIFHSQQQQVQFEFLPWPRALKQARQGDAVAIVTIWYDEERTVDLDYPSPLYLNYVRFFHRTANPVQFRQLSELSKKQRLRIGIVRGYSYHPSVHRLPVTFVELNSDLESLQMLALGRVDLVIAEQMVAEYLLGNDLKRYHDQISVTGPVLEEKPMYLAFSKKHPASAALRQQFEQGLQRLKQQKKLSSLLPTYQAVPTDSQPALESRRPEQQ